MSERSTGTVVDPGVRIFLGLLAAVRWPPMHRRTVAQARDDFRLLSAATGTWTAVRSVCDTRVSTSRGPTGAAAQRFGKYLTVWRKEPNGTWKFVVDGGNSRPSPVGQ